MRHKEAGNAFVYILVAVVLFAALSFILVRQEDTKETGVITPEKAKILATQLITTATQIKSALDQMQFAGTDPSEIDFAKPGAFGAAPHFDKVFHPDGGGVTLPPLPKDAIADDFGNNPGPGWYLGRFNNVEWSPTTADEVILTAHAIHPIVCAQINKVITGDETIPALNLNSREVLIDSIEHSSGNTDFNRVNCAGCDDNASLCVSNSLVDRYTYYNILISR